MICHFILYVSDQIKSTAFYAEVLSLKPRLDVPGMTEFEISNNCILGLMPSSSIKKLLGDTIQDPQLADQIPRAEIYLRVHDPVLYFERSLRAGAILLSHVQKRNWGATVGYLADLDGHVIAFSDFN